MSEFDDKHLDFVVRHYEAGRFDTQKAIDGFNRAHPVQEKPRKANFAWIYSVAAAVAVIVGLFFIWDSSRVQPNELAACSEQVCGLLPDSTQVTLSPGSTLRYAYSKNSSRKIEMTGKVYFDVARDESRPFEISTGNSYVKVLGTSFQVDASVSAGKTVEVYVASGKVFFARSQESEGVVLEKGMGATLPDGMLMPVLNTRDKVNAIAWKRGTFIFDQTPLKEVLKTLSDHYHVSFVCTDLSKHLSGEFDIDNLDLIISIIESALDVNIMKI